MSNNLIYRISVQTQLVFIGPCRELWHSWGKETEDRKQQTWNAEFVTFRRKNIKLNPHLFSPQDENLASHLDFFVSGSAEENPMIKRIKVQSMWTALTNALLKPLLFKQKHDFYRRRTITQHKTKIKMNPFPFWGHIFDCRIQKAWTDGAGCVDHLARHSGNFPSTFVGIFLKKSGNLWKK